MELFNGTPIPIVGLAEGNRYEVGPGEILTLENHEHAKVMLQNLAPRGLRQIRHGEDQEAIREEANAALAEHILRNVEEYNAVQLDLSRQGLKLLPPNKQLKELSKVLVRLGESPIEVTTQADVDADPLASVLQQLAAGAKRLGETEEGKKLAGLLKELSSVRGDPAEVVEERAKILDASDLHGATGTARVRANARGRQIRRGQAAKGKAE